MAVSGVLKEGTSFRDFYEQNKHYSYYSTYGPKL